jgi:hypothetical protein
MKRMSVLTKCVNELEVEIGIGIGLRGHAKTRGGMSRENRRREIHAKARSVRKERERRIAGEVRLRNSATPFI